MAVAHWLLKSEPQEWSWQHQDANGGLSHWDGVRNPQAQKYLKAMRLGDLCLFYHSGKSKEIVGISSVCKSFYPDPSDASGKCGMVDIRAVSPFPHPVSLARLKLDESLKDFVLFRQPRLSVMPVSDIVWKRICELGDEELPQARDESEGRNELKEKRSDARRAQNKKNKMKSKGSPDEKSDSLKDTAGDPERLNEIELGRLTKTKSKSIVNANSPIAQEATRNQRRKRSRTA